MVLLCLFLLSSHHLSLCYRSTFYLFHASDYGSLSPRTMENLDMMNCLEEMSVASVLLTETTYSLRLENVCINIYVGYIEQKLKTIVSGRKFLFDDVKCGNFTHTIV